MDPTIDELLTQHWGLAGADIHQLGGGMNSTTWSVLAGSEQFVAKMVASSESAQLRAGCDIADQLDQHGLITGAPVPTLDGQLLVAVPPLALLKFVGGRELDGRTDEQQQWIARMLARVHAAGVPGPGAHLPVFFPWLRGDAPGVAALPWLPPAIQALRSELEPLAFTWSIVHTDPAPEAFLRDDTSGVTGLIDWTGAQRGPVLYDIASAVMYLGGRDQAAAFLESYRMDGVLDDRELEHLDIWRRFRWLVQAVYFAGRLHDRNLTGLTDQSDNEKGLQDARAGLAALSHPEVLINGT